MINLETVQELVNAEDFAKQLGAYLAIEIHNEKSLCGPDGMVMINEIDFSMLSQAASLLCSQLDELLESGFITDSDIVNQIQTLLNKFNNFESFEDECLKQAQTSLELIRDDFRD